MKSWLSLSWKELKAQKITSILILIALILSTIATTALGQSIGILQSMRIKQAASLNGDRYATFHQATEKQRALLFSDSRLTDLGSFITLGHTDLIDSGLTLFIREYQGNAIKAYPSSYTLKEGKLPETKNEIALPQDALQCLGFQGKLGDTVTLPLSISRKTDDRPPYEYKARFILTGILKTDYLGYATGTVTGAVGKGAALALLPERYFLYSIDCKTKSTRQFQSTISELSRQLDIPEADIQYNWVLLDAMGINYNEKNQTDNEESGFPFLTAACILVGALSLLAAGLVIYNILKVAVTKRIRQYGTLRAMGSEKKQLYLLVTTQLLILCAAGLPAGLALGALCSRGILTAATGLLNPQLFGAQTSLQVKELIAQSSSFGPLFLLISIAVTLLFAVLAAFPSAYYASRVSPAVAMRGSHQSVKRRSRKEKQIHSFGAFYARLNLKRNKKRTAITILSIVMSITVFTVLQSFTNLLDAGQDIQKMHLGDYAVTGEGSGISPEAVSKMKEQDMIKELFTSKLTVYTGDKQGNLPIKLDISLQPGETFQIAAVDKKRLSDYGQKLKLSENDLRNLKRGTACLVKNPVAFAQEGKTLPHTELKSGESISINGKGLQIAGLINDPISIGNKGFLNGVQILVSQSLYNTLAGTSRYSEVYPVLADDADEKAFEAWLKTWCNENPGTHWLSYRETDAQLAESFQQIRILCWGIILFMALIGVLNIINTVYTGIHTRINEIGIQRAMGMSASLLYRTFLWEGAYYGLIASAAGAVCGYLCSIFIETAVSESLQLTTAPLLPIAEAALVSILACLGATAIPLQAISKINIVNSIETVE